MNESIVSILTFGASDPPASSWFPTSTCGESIDGEQKPSLHLTDRVKLSPQRERQDVLTGEFPRDPVTGQSLLAFDAADFPDHSNYKASVEIVSIVYPIPVSTSCGLSRFGA